MSRNFARRLDQRKTVAIGRAVVAPHIERVFARVEARLASLHAAVVRVGFANLKLEVATLEVFVKAFVGDDDFLLRCLGLDFCRRFALACCHVLPSVPC